MSDAPRLQVSHLTKRFGVTAVLSDITLSVPSGEILALLGENGAGKSTLLRIMAGLTKPTSGTVLVGGKPLVVSSSTAAMRAGIRMVHQELSVVPELTVAENLALADPDGRRALASYGRATVETATLMTRLGWDLEPGAMVSGLSLAQRSLLEIAKALYFNPRVLLLDEPTAALQADDVQRLFRVVRDVAQQGTTVIFVSHRLQEVYEFAHRLVVLKDGLLVREGVPSELPEAEAVAAMVGRDLPALFPAKGTSFVGGEAAVLRCSVVIGRDAEPCEVELRRGEILGVGGLEGQGQHELLRALAGLSPISGWVEVDGNRTASHSPQQAVEKGLGYIPSDRQREGLALHLSIQRNLEAVLMRRQSGIVAKVSTLSRAARDVAMEFSLKVQSFESEVGRLSGGNQQKVVLGRWLMAPLRALLLDEPTRGVDVATKAEIYHRLRDLAAAGTGVLFASSDMLELIGLADRVIVMRDGEIVGSLAGPDLSEQGVVALAVGQREALSRVKE